jgi:ABC-type uncharacterized transport system involved in gliding motility auxiliary subunit
MEIEQNKNEPLISSQTPSEEKPIVQINKPGLNKKRFIWLNVVAMVIIGIIIFAGVNYLGNRYYYRQDCTFQQSYALSDKTKNILKHLPRPVHIYALLTNNHPIIPRIKDLLEEYKMSSYKVKVELINIVEDPALADARIKYLRDNLNIRAVLQPNDIVLVCGDKSRVIPLRETYHARYHGNQEVGIGTFRGEEAFTSGILSIIQDKKTKVYFTEGHNEPVLEGWGQDEIGYLNGILRGENMEVNKVNLHVKEGIPADTDVLIIAGPTESFLPDEITMLKNYLERGGKLMVFAGAGIDVNLGSVIKEWGVTLAENVVLDAQCAKILGSMEDIRIPLVTDYGASFGNPITKDLKERKINTAFVIARSIEVIKPMPQGLEILELARSSARSWGETDFNSLMQGTSRYEKDFDRKGPLTLGVSIKKMLSPENQNSDLETRLIILGSSEMAKNKFLSPRSSYYMGSSDLILNSIRWLTLQEQFITIEAKKPEDTSINFNVGKRSLLLLLISLVFVPLSGIILGIVVWVIRRK